MRCFIGIDLGSTTTKAVVIDENHNILGRGITNSRSNYDTAAAIVDHETILSDPGTPEQLMARARQLVIAAGGGSRPRSR